MSVTQMETEAFSAPIILANQFKENFSPLEELGLRLREHKPPFIMTVARGSSDHAATFAKYLLETRAGIVTASAAPSVHTIYDAKIKFKKCFSISDFTIGTKS